MHVMRAPMAIAMSIISWSFFINEKVTAACRKSERGLYCPLDARVPEMST